MNASILEVESFNAEQTTVVNLTGVPIEIRDEAPVSFGQWQKVNQNQIRIEEKSFSLQHGLNILYRAGGGGENFTLNITDQPPQDEVYLHILHLDVSKPLITIKARYGDEIAKHLPFRGKSEPLLLYAPMDLPLDLYQLDGTLFGSWEGYVTKENTHIIFIVIEHTKQPLWVIELH